MQNATACDIILKLDLRGQSSAFLCTKALLYLDTKYVQEEKRMKELIIKNFTADQIKAEPFPFEIGSTVKVHVKIKEGNRERIQVFEGTVIAKKHGGVSETVTVRRVSYGVGVERTFPVNSPVIDKVEVVRKGKVRRAKLYYLRDRVGKAAKVKEQL